jgi:hypothetical protein
MVDVVANHMGQAAISDNRPEPLNQQSSYHTDCAIDYSNQTSVENCEIANLPDVDTQDSNIRSLYQTWIKWLVNEYSFDGVRIDTVCRKSLSDRRRRTSCLLMTGEACREGFLVPVLRRRRSVLDW